MDWYDISDHDWLETAFGDVNSDGYFDVVPEEPALTDLYVGPPDDDSLDPAEAQTQQPALAEQDDPKWEMLGGDTDAPLGSDHFDLDTPIASQADGWLVINTGQTSASPW